MAFWRLLPLVQTEYMEHTYTKSKELPKKLKIYFFGQRPGNLPHSIFIHGPL